MDEKPIIEYNIDRLSSFGVSNLVVTLRYFGEQIVEYFGNGEQKGINLSYVTEETALGTIGAISLIPEFKNNNVLIMNSDLLTNIDFADFTISLFQKMLMSQSLQFLTK